MEEKKVKPRKATVSRHTTETQIKLSLNLNGGAVKISTGVGFLDHMLTLFANHGGFGLSINAKGDAYVDDHHTTEDIGIALGQAFYEAAGNKKGIARYGHILLPMDEALVEVAVDFSGRSFARSDLPFHAAKTGSFDLSLIEEFFRSFAMNAKITLHINLRYGKNDHHIAEAAFKATARALKQALRIDSDIIPSTKGVIE